MINFMRKPEQLDPVVKEKTMIKGIDVSHYQERLDWKKAWDLGYRFAFAKASDGERGGDKMFSTHKADAKAAGFIFGAYHFMRLEQDAAKQMHNFLSLAGTVEPGELPHTIDVEWDKTSEMYGEGKSMDAEAAETAFLAATLIGHSMKMLPIVYTNYYFWNPGTRGPSWEQMPLWVPAYHTTKEKIKVPPPWKQWAFWQDGDALKIGNVTGIDTNVFNGSLDDLKAMTKK